MSSPLGSSGAVDVVLALGSNLGSRRATLDEAVAALARAGGLEVVAVSPVVETVAVTVDGPDPSAPRYLNAVALARTTLDPDALLDLAHRVEAELGRVRDRRWGDRTIDIDIVTMDGVLRDDARLVLPHPRAAERDFVLEPWLLLDPDAELPGAGRVDALLAGLRAGAADADMAVAVDGAAGAGAGAAGAGADAATGAEGAER
ncbi:2-amino-4-hydroxy-6-hydroxymethyldihydropteridine diphosphokinase [Mycetocola reblochoni]|uniref:2-amino-4-hydroxy-6-hydroxymethyldihydropteridine diphosphokinase n=1 Tax=Mycetocola reblochoni REB411 TaxID=1255698 RepID=A0A1R4I7A2_9MICO|nr:2-amino-4-hydroxy-6-hydroxymethyldihydropteridine diphosphokinase [Mycetocola reblochoni]SJN15639.1 2-amino-4-hydroxy-6-hydroxymethyldihydropteridinepyrophosphokinase [Mycetocola reblochoni REB411]